MADNTVLPAGVGGDSIRDIDRAGIKTQVAQIDVGGTLAESLVTAANPMPVTLATGAATSALQTSGNVSTASIDTKTPALGQALAAASSPVVLTAAQIITLTPPAAITGFALEAGHLATIDSHIPALGQALSAASVPVVLTAAQLTTLTPLATVGVTGTFFQATQPVSLATNTPDVTDRAGRLVGVVTAANLDVALSTRLKPTDTLTGVTTVAAVTAITNALPAGANLMGKVGIDQTTPGTTNLVAAKPLDSAGADLTSAKFAQTSRFLGVAQAHDTGRVTRNFMLDAITAAPLVEALATVVQWYNNAAVAGTTTPAVVPAGKVLRLSSWKIQYQSLATVGYAVVRIRCNVAGVVVIGSPLVYSFEAGSGAGATTAAMTGGVTTEAGDFPEGLEIPAAAGIGFSFAGYGPTGALTLEGGVRFTVMGYEY